MFNNQRDALKCGMRLIDDTQYRGHAQTIRDIEQVYRGDRIAVWKLIRETETHRNSIIHLKV